MKRMDSARRRLVPPSIPALLLLAMVAFAAASLALAQTAPSTEGAVSPRGGGEASLKVPDLGQVDFEGVSGPTLLMAGLVICAFGLLFGQIGRASCRERV